MLVLRRKKGEQIVIGEDISVTIVDIQKNSVKLAFEARPEIPIHRGEVHRRLQLEAEGLLPPLKSRVAKVRSA